MSGGTVGDLLATGPRGPDVNGPAAVPALRSWCLSQWAPGSYWAKAAPALTSFGFPGPFVEHERASLRSASLYWVAAEMVDVLNACAAGIPDETRVEDIPRPATAGFVVFGAPVMGTDAIHSLPVRVNAILWDHVLLPDLSRPYDERDPLAHVVDGVSISSYAAPGHSELTGQEMPFWLPLGRSDWPIADALGQRPTRIGFVREDTWASFLEDRRALAALWGLLSSPGVATQASLPAARPVRRAHLRAKITGSPDVTVVNLRGHAARPAGEQDGEGRRAPDHRWMVSGHWRRQPYGPGRAERRLTFIQPHVKGPDGAPLRTKEKVYALRPEGREP